MNALSTDTLLDEGIRRQNEGDLTGAEECYQQVLAVDADNYDALQLLGLGLLQRGDMNAGITLIERSLLIEPRQVGTLHNLAVAFRRTGRPSEAIAAFRRALALDPQHGQSLMGLGQALASAGDLREAARCYQSLLGGDERNPELYMSIGNLLRVVGRPREAAANFRHALQVAPITREFAVRAMSAVGAALREGGEDVGALTAFRAAEELNPSLELTTFRAHTALQLVEWQDWERDVARLAAADVSRERVSDPLSTMYLPASALQLRHAAEASARWHFNRAEKLPPRRPPVRSPQRRIRVAYLSPDLRNHAVGNILPEVFGLHDRTRFEVFAYSWGPNDDSDVRERIRRSCDVFEEAGNLTDLDLAQNLQAANIDIAVDLAGYTAFNRPGVFAARPAPIQVGWLGYPGTSGASYIDYLIADDFTVPRGAEAAFSEQIVRLPHTFMPYDRSRTIATPLTRTEYGLPEDAVVLACFGQMRKITPPVFGAWMEVLRAVPEAVLWLTSQRDSVIANLQREAAARGVAPDRLIIKPGFHDPAQHLARYRVVDLTLDTYPYGSHSTALDALWAGCPLIALTGETFVSRVSGSVLHAAGFSELVTRDLQGYRDLALSLARDRALRTDIRQRLESTRSNCALFDMPRFVHSLEQAYDQIWQRHLRDEAPRTFSVANTN